MTDSKCATCNHPQSDHRRDNDKSGYPCFHEEVNENSGLVRTWDFCMCKAYISEEHVSATRSLRST